MTSEKVSRPICRPIYNQESSIHQCSETMTANPDENPSCCEYQSDSTVQGTSRETKEKKGEPIKVEGAKK